MRMITRAISSVAAAVLASAIFGGAVHAEQKKRALLIGISDYKNIRPLDNPKNDVSFLAQKLKSVGYETTIASKGDETTRSALIDTFESFIKSIDQDDEVIVFYAGHGIEVGENLIVPSDSPPFHKIGSKESLPKHLLGFRDFMVQIEDRSPAVHIWIIDACRENPYAGTTRDFVQKPGLGRPDTIPNTFVLFSANYGQLAKDRLDDEEPGNNLGSPFSRSMISLFDAWKDKSISEYAKEIRKEVIRLVAPDPQFPIFLDGIVDSWCLVKCSAGVQSIALADVRKPTAPVVSISAPENSAKIAGLPNLTALDTPAPVVYLGKLTAIDCKPGSVSDLYPFGCDALKNAVAAVTEGSTASQRALTRNIVARTGVYLRIGLPKVHESGTQFGCKSRVVLPGEKVTISKVTAVKYASDTFYWGVVEGASSAKCSESVSLRDSRPSPQAYRTPN